MVAEYAEVTAKAVDDCAARDGALMGDRFGIVRPLLIGCRWSRLTLFVIQP